MSVSTADVIDAISEITSENMASVEYLEPEDLEALRAVVRSFLTRRERKERWSAAVGPFLRHNEVLRMGAWSRQSLSQAVKEGRVLKLTTGTHETLYPLWQFDGSEDGRIRPYPVLRKLTHSWKEVDKRGWALASWLSTPQPEFEERRPRELLDTRPDAVAVAARQAAARLDA